MINQYMAQDDALAKHHFMVTITKNTVPTLRIFIHKHKMILNLETCSIKE